MAAPTASGSAARIALAFESVFGTNPGTGFNYIPAISWDLAESQGFLPQDQIGQGRDPGRPERDVIELTGRCTVPVDVRSIGYWLTLAFGSPTTQADTPTLGVHTHTWQSGADSLPSATVEEQFPDLATPEFHLTVGVMVNGFTLRLEPRGRANVELDLIGKTKTRSTSTAAGSPATPAVARFNQNHSLIQRNNTDLAKILSASVPYQNQLEVNRYVGGGGSIGDINPGLVSAQGEITARLHPGLSTLFTDALNETVFDLDLGFERTANESLIFAVEQAELGRPRVTIPGPGGVEVRFNWSGSANGSTIQSLKAILINDVTGYAAP